VPPSPRMDFADDAHFAEGWALGNDSFCQDWICRVPEIWHSGNPEALGNVHVSSSVCWRVPNVCRVSAPRHMVNRLFAVCPRKSPRQISCFRQWKHHAYTNAGHKGMHVRMAWPEIDRQGTGLASAQKYPATSLQRSRHPVSLTASERPMTWKTMGLLV
jgi:hypothetical protein